MINPIMDAFSSGVPLVLIEKTTAEWTTQNPKLKKFEIGKDTELSTLKLGNGVSRYADLSPIGGSGGGGAWGSITGSIGAQTDLVTNYGPVGVKRFTALLTQSGTSAPVPAILENSLGVVPSFVYNNTGVYSATATGAFPSDSKALFILNGGDNTTTPFFFAYWGNANSFYIETRNSAFVYTNGMLSNSPLQITVYP